MNPSPPIARLTRTQLLRRTAVALAVIVLVLLLFPVPDPASIARLGGTPGRGSLVLLPALVAVGLAIAWRQVHLPLLLGVAAGAWVLDPAGLSAPLRAVWRSISHFIVQRKVYDWTQPDEPWQAFYLHIVLFVSLLMTMVGVIGRAGGTDALAQRLIGATGSGRDGPRARRRARVATWVLGLAVFFDDYTNTVVVGTSMGPIYDRLRLAREKLAYLVDSTAAPVAGLSLLSTWVAYEVSQFAPSLPAAGLAESDGYRLFIASLPYRYYCWVALAVAGASAWGLGDFTAMRRAAHRAQQGAPGDPTAASQGRDRAAGRTVRPLLSTAVVPLLVTMGVILGAIVYQGPDAAEGLGGFAWLRAALAGIDLSPWLSRAAGAGLLAAVLMALGPARMPLKALWPLARRTARLLAPALALVLLAWGLGAVSEDLGTGVWLAALVSDVGRPEVLPPALFLLSSAVAFATGTSWATMAILLPVAVPLTAALVEGSAWTVEGLLVISIGAVLDGSIFGDHCSPISDTTVLSSVASGCDHLSHVRTQLPYALLSMGVALALGYIPAVMGLPGVAALVLAVSAAVVLLWRFGRD